MDFGLSFGYLFTSHCLINLFICVCLLGPRVHVTIGANRQPKSFMCYLGTWVASQNLARVPLAFYVRTFYSRPGQLVLRGEELFMYGKEADVMGRVVFMIHRPICGEPVSSQYLRSLESHAWSCDPSVS
ncbi:hypothetical protein LY76DRAFT_212243 [Colletotrichum caudatum]|nr:hypothetical protein LY76DRAFT_212243 [Colletotrichum caudatum]